MKMTISVSTDEGEVVAAVDMDLAKDQLMAPGFDKSMVQPALFELRRRMVGSLVFPIVFDPQPE